jgi:translation elongation factor EF-1beta
MRKHLATKEQILIAISGGLVLDFDRKKINVEKFYSDIEDIEEGLSWFSEKDQEAIKLELKPLNFGLVALILRGLAEDKTQYNLDKFLRGIKNDEYTLTWNDFLY